jgi:sulfide dehydrogenase cytochrome subunit
MNFPNPDIENTKTAHVLNTTEKSARNLISNESSSVFVKSLCSSISGQLKRVSLLKFGKIEINKSITIVMLLLLSINIFAADINEITKQCNDCHGKKGLSSDEDIPIIAGQSQVLIEDALLAFSQKERPCKQSKYRHGDTSRASISMCEIAAKLSEDEIYDLSEYYGNLKFIGTKQEFNQALVKRGGQLHQRHCEKCHSEGGSLADDDAGILAGQWIAYLRSSVEKFLAGKRPMADKMSIKIKRLSEEDLEALFNFYAKNTAAQDSE